MPRYQYIEKQRQNVAFLGELVPGDVVELTEKQAEYVDEKSTDTFRKVPDSTPLKRQAKSAAAKVQTQNPSATQSTVTEKE